MLNAGASQTRSRLTAKQDSRPAVELPYARPAVVEEGNTEGDACITTSVDELPPSPQPPAATDCATSANLSANYTV